MTTAQTIRTMMQRIVEAVNESQLPPSVVSLALDRLRAQIAELEARELAQDTEKEDADGTLQREA